MRLNQYPQTTTLDATDTLIIDGESGVRTLPLADLPTKLLDVETQEQYFETLDALIPPEQRRTIYRGKNLGSVVTDEQYASISNGSFKGLFLGDYWLINGIHWRIADFDYWYGFGQLEYRIDTHHLVIFPDDVLLESKLRNTDTSDGGLLATRFFSTSEVNQSLHDKIKDEFLHPAFGYSHLLVFSDIVTNSTVAGTPASAIYKTMQLMLPTEPMIFGAITYMNASHSNVIAHNGSMSKSQLALLAANRRFIKTTSGHCYWEQEISTSHCITGVDGGRGVPSIYNTNEPHLWIRPVFGIREEKTK